VFEELEDALEARPILRIVNYHVCGLPVRLVGIRRLKPPMHAADNILCHPLLRFTA
jgi:hypothetical protein